MNYIYKLEDKLYGIDDLSVRTFNNKKDLEDYLFNYLTYNTYTLKQIFEIVDNINVIIENSNKRNKLKFCEFCNIKEFKKRIQERYASIIKTLNRIDNNRTK